MRHNFYANCKSGVLPGGKRKRLDQSRQPPYHTKSKDMINKFIIPLGQLADLVVMEYSEDPKTLDAIHNKVDTYCINVTIAEDLGSNKLVKSLKKELRDYLIKLYVKEK